MFTSELTHDGHIRRLTITRSVSGWEIREEHDSQVVRTTIYSDWHRVERARQLFAIENQLPLLADGYSTNL